MPSPDPSNVSVTPQNDVSSNYNSSSWNDILVRVYQTDGVGAIDTIMYDFDIFLDNIETVDGHRIEAYNTDITGFEDCLLNDCDPYQYGRDVVFETDHWKDGGGNVFIHPNDSGGSEEGGTFGGTSHNNHIAMPCKYSNEFKGPISIKGHDAPKDDKCEDRSMHYGACHELAHQLHSSTDYWDSSYGCSPYFNDCVDGSGFDYDPHYLADVIATCDGGDHHSVMGGNTEFTSCGQCKSSKSGFYPKFDVSSCHNNAIGDCIDYVKNSSDFC